MNNALCSRVLTPSTVWVITIACTVAVGSVYYNQPLLALIRETFAVPASQASLIPTLTQFGYAVGMLVLLPLGDLVQRRRLIVALSGLNAIALTAAALAPSFTGLAIASFAIGSTAVVPQLLIPLATQLTEPERRGQIVGTVMSGLLVGIVVGRFAGGLSGALWGWRSMFGIAAVLMVCLALLLARRLPGVPASAQLSYAALLRSLTTLVAEQPMLRQASLLGALLFCIYSGFWAILPFLLEHPPFELGTQVTGMFGLVGIAGAFGAPLLGKIVDRTSPGFVLNLAIALFVTALLLIWQFHSTLWGLAIGAVLLDLGTQTGQISNKARIYSLPAEVHNRLTTVYMVAFFAGGSIGSWLSSYGIRLMG